MRRTCYAGAMFSRRLLVSFFAVIFAFGCATERGLKVIDFKDAKRAIWAEPKQTFRSSETPLVRVYGYGGHTVRLELWKDSQTLLGVGTNAIPKQVISRSYEGLGFRNSYSDVELVERERVSWNSTDWFLRLRPLRPGKYELRLKSDDGNTQSAAFTVEP